MRLLHSPQVNLLVGSESCVVVVIITIIIIIISVGLNRNCKKLTRVQLTSFVYLVRAENFLEIEANLKN